jgi:hypothetical protein
MHLRAPLIAYVLTCSLLGPHGCASSASVSEREAQAVLGVVLDSLEARSIRGTASATSPRPLVLVLTSSIPPSLRQASQALRPTVADVDLTGLEKFSLPAGHLQPEVLEIQGDTAVFRGLLGPVPAPGTLGASSACGQHHEIQLSRQSDGSWRIASASVNVC